MNYLVRAICFASVFASLGHAQSLTHRVSSTYDSVSAPSAGTIPGLGGAFREQILIDAHRLQGLGGRAIEGIQFRRSLDPNEVLEGGAVAMTVWLHEVSGVAASASSNFADNAPVAQRVEVFKGVLIVPSSPKVGSLPNAWSTANSFQIVFRTPFSYSGGTLVVELLAAPKATGTPGRWPLDCEHVTHDGMASTFGSSCSSFAMSDGLALVAEDSGLQVGGTARVLSFGRPGTRPVLLLGVTPLTQGIDLAGLGATGCFQFVDYFLSQGLVYQTPIPNFASAHAEVLLKIPLDPSLFKAQLTMQSADIETGLPQASWTNSAGLTTSNGLTLQLASTQPTLGMSTVQSTTIGLGQSAPVSGRVDVERAPVMRLLYR